MKPWIGPEDVLTRSPDPWMLAPSEEGAAKALRVQNAAKREISEIHILAFLQGS